MSDTITAAKYTVIGGLLVAVPTWYFTYASQQETIRKNSFDMETVRKAEKTEHDKALKYGEERDTLARQIADASKTFTSLMDPLIVKLKSASDLSRRAPADGNPQLISAARDATAARKDFSDVISQLVENLNNEFSGLANALTSGKPDMEELRRAADALAGAWPAKKAKLEIAVTAFLNKSGIKVAGP